MPETAPKVAVIVAHPDDETLWCGGLMLRHPEWRLHVAALCRGDDADRRDELPRRIWEAKRGVIVDVYGFAPESWEARATPHEEGFWCFDSPAAAVERVAASEAPR